jgi:hypothetical protein
VLNWFTVIEKELTRPLILPENVYNMDETGVQLSVQKSLKVLVGKDELCNYSGAGVNKRTLITAIKVYPSRQWVSPPPLFFLLFFLIHTSRSPLKLSRATSALFRLNSTMAIYSETNTGYTCYLETIILSTTLEQDK